ncbi:MAG: MFS transporter [Gammaproteobacteria bacterium]|nr:MFS transporter [Gammaproteobacteria bacterium]
MQADDQATGDLARRLARALPAHYGWIIVVTGLLIVFACLGIGRFALGMLLPSMGLSLSLSYAQMGLISTANFVGYLLAVVACGRLVRVYGARAVIAGALLTIGLTMVLIARSDAFLAVLLLYTVTGLGSGAANVPIMGLVSHWFARRLRGRAAGFIVIGSGFAIMFTGMLIPAVNATWGAEGWRYSWLFLGLAVVAIAALAGLLLRNDPRDVGLGICGDAPADADRPPAPAVEPDAATRRRVLARLGAIYFLFGFTYVIYATFIVTTLVQERGFSEAVAGRFWFWVGFLSLFSGPVFGYLSDHAGRKVGMATVFAMHAGAYLCAGLPLPEPFLYLSIALFGLAAWSIPGIMAATVGDYMGPRHAVAGFGTITFVFGIGQITGPGLAGIFAEASGSFASSFLMAAGLAGLALVLTVTTLPRAAAE